MSLYRSAARTAKSTDLIEKVETMKAAVLVSKLLTLSTSFSTMTCYRFIHLGTACGAIMKIALVTANDITPLTSLFLFVWLLSNGQVPVNKSSR